MVFSWIIVFCTCFLDFYIFSFLTFNFFPLYTPTAIPEAYKGGGYGGSASPLISKIYGSQTPTDPETPLKRKKLILPVNAPGCHIFLLFSHRTHLLLLSFDSINSFLDLLLSLLSGSFTFFLSL